jgi:hypothetical protein
MDDHVAFLSAAPAGAPTTNFVLHLQQTYGNRYVQRLVESVKAQAKLTVNAPNDVYEQEADRVADATTSTVNSSIQHQREEEEEEPIQAKMVSEIQRQAEDEEELQMEVVESQPVNVSDHLETQINAARGHGAPLPDTMREPMGQAFGADFSGVHVHTDSEADALNRDLSAKAFTTGQDVFFRQGEYSPSSDSGRKLIAHELTHVVQQTSGNKLQGQAEDEVMGKTVSKIQRHPEDEEEELQTKSISSIQRQAEKEEEIRAKPLKTIGTPVVQRNNGGASGFGHLLNFWKGLESKGKEIYGDLKALAGRYKGEHIKSPIAKAIMANAAQNAQATGEDLVTYMNREYNWSQEDVEKYIYEHEKPFVKYITSEAAREEYELVGGATLKQGKPPHPFDTTGMFSKHSGQDFGIYVMAPDGRIYSGVHKVGLFHHSSFLAGLPTASAGELKVQAGTLQHITNKSGHYQPGRAQMVNSLKQLRGRGVNLDGVRLDMVNEIDNYPGGAKKFLEDEERRAAQARARVSSPYDVYIPA